jgi:hypothetical protein
LWSSIGLKGALVADYSFVRGPDGEVVGLWIRDKKLAATRSYVVILLKKHMGALAEVRKPITEEVLGMALSGEYREVPNTFDKKGGCFIMFGQALAPGEVA